jgi:hypothetical protein
MPLGQSARHQGANPRIDQGRYKPRSDFMKRLTKQQKAALMRVFQRNDPKPDHPINRREWFRRYRKFRRTAFVAFGDCLMVPWAGMTLGIEADGYTHS